MIICGMDIATRSGIAILDGDKPLHIEAFRPAGKSDDEIFHGFRVWLRPMLIAHRVEHAAIEEPLRSDLKRRNPDGTEEALTNMRTYLRLYGLRAHAIEVFRSLNIPWNEVNQSSWRKAFLANGRADKDAAVRQCQLLRWPVPNKDAAEACGVAWWLAGHIRSSRLVRPGDLFEEHAA
jgi:Holliday junction resolvasome RuvABC endonuclease subunit